MENWAAGGGEARRRTGNSPDGEASGAISAPGWIKTLVILSAAKDLFSDSERASLCTKRSFAFGSG
jgi:hypothetical protein